MVLEIAAGEPCDRVTDGHLSLITELVVGKKGLNTLKAGDFGGLSSVEWLDLTGNDLTELPEDMFSELSNLKVLVLTDNRFTELPADTFAGLSSLEELWLDANALKAVPEKVFAGLSKLKVLRLDLNRLTQLPPGLFTDLESLEDLRLDGNRLSALPDGIFSGLSKLRRLQLGFNQLSSLGKQPLAELAALEELDLYDNQFWQLPADSFAGLARLRKLDLGNNPFSTLPAELFSDLADLEDLDIWNSQLTSLPPGIFGGLSRLNRLWIGHNELSTLPGNVFSNLAALRELNLAYNRLSNLPDGIFSGLSSLESLILDSNLVDPLPLGLTLERVGNNQLKAVAPTGAPFTLELPLTVSNGGELAGGANSVTIPAGGVESVPLTVTRVDMDTNIVTVDITSLPSHPPKHRGYVLEKDAALPIEIPLPEEVSPPAQVTGIEVARGVRSLRVSWAAVSGTDGYKVQWKSGDDTYDESRQAVVAGGDTVNYTITGLTEGAEYTVRVLATRSGADDGLFSEEVTGTTRSGDPDVNGDGVLDGDDAQIMYYAYRFASLVGDGETGGTEASRKRFLGGYSGLADPSDEDLRAMVAKAITWRKEGLNEGGDINADGMIDDSDALAMYRAYTYESLLGDGEEGGAARFRLQLLGRLAGKENPTDDELKAMLRRANELREAYSG